MTRLHIGHFLYHYPQPCGTTTAVRGLSRALVRMGHKVTIYCCGEASAPHGHEAEEPNHLRVLRFQPGCARKYPFHIPEQLQARVSNNDDKIDLLVLHGIFNPRLFAMARTAQCAGIPYVVCPHGLYHPHLLRKHRFRKALYGILFERPMLNGARAVQVFDEYHIRFLNDYCVHAPIMVIPNGFNPLEVLAFRPGEKAGRPWNRDTNAEFLFLGRIDMRTKGLDLLFLALSRGIREGKIPESLRLKIVGPDFGDKAKLVCLADQLSIAKSVTFCDGVDEQRRWSVVTSSDLLVLPSRHDAFPTVVLEAMAAGTPVIVSENTGMSSWVRKAQCGLLVQPTVESICAGLVSALDCREHWRTMGEAGRNYAYSYLTWERVGHEASRCYEKLLGHANGKSDFQAVQSPECV